MRSVKKAVKYLISNSFLKNVNIRRALPDCFSDTHIYVTPDARLKFVKPGKSVFTKDYSGLIYLAKHVVEQGDTVWDIGANVGVFTFAAANKAGSLGEVISVEADTFLVQLLRKSTRIDTNSDLNIKVLPAAISDVNTISSLMISSSGRNTNSLKSEAKQLNNNYNDEVLVPTYTLDTLSKYYQAPDVLKIDVEGAEYKVLSGGSEIIGSAKPTIYCEVKSNNVKKVTSFLNNHNYKLYGLKDGGIEKINKCIFNTLAIPSR